MTKDVKVKVEKAKPAAGFYLLTYIGALIYFFDRAEGFGESLLAFLQAAVWPAYLVNRIFTMLQIQ